jgi:hemoglobin-like flavoprotein
MTASDTQIRLMRESLPRIRERLVPASRDFYENPFAIVPELRTLFRSDNASQGMRSMFTMATIVGLLDAPAELGTEIHDLAKAHAGVGAQASHFAPMGAALMVPWPRPSARNSRPSSRRRGMPPTATSRHK